VGVCLLQAVRHWLASSDTPETAALIFVLAGRQHRKLCALDLYKNGYAPRLILSVGRFEIRRFETLSLPVTVPLLELAAPVPAPERHFFVCFENGHVQVERIAVRRPGTLNEIRALRDWLARRSEITSVLVVTSGVHARRVRLCCRTLLDTGVHVHVMNAPDASDIVDEPRDGTWKELLKLVAYWVWLALAFGRTRRTK
jgi:hypothetical protein